MTPDLNAVPCSRARGHCFAARQSANLSRVIKSPQIRMMTSFMLDVPCCSGKAVPRNSQRGLIFVHTKKHSASWVRKHVDLHGSSSLLEDLNAPPHRCQEKHIQKIQSENSSRTRHTVRVPDLMILSASPERSPGETLHTKQIKAKIYRERGHGTSSRPEDLGRVA